MNVSTAPLSTEHEECIVQVLEVLSSHLSDLVFASQATPLSQKLASLPQAWHERILTANFPSIIRSSSLSLNGVHEGRWLSSHAYSSLFSAMQTLTSLLELFIDFFLLRGACRQQDVFTLLTQTVSGLHSLRALQLRRVSEQVPNLNSIQLWQVVRRLTALTAFEVTHSEIHPECAWPNFAAVHCLTHLKRLVIRPPAVRTKLWGWIRDPRWMRDPRFGDRVVQECAAAGLQASLQQLSQLTHLDLHGYHAMWTSHTIACNTVDLSHLQHLRYLDLSDLCFDGPSQRRIFLNLSGCSGLQHLDLSHRLVDETSLAECLPALSALSHLSLCFAVEGTAAQVMACCALHCAKLSTLQLDLHHISGSSAELPAAVRSSVGLTNALTCLELESYICAQWCSMLTAFSSLERLEVHGDWVGDLHPLCGSVRNVPQLKSLTLGGVPPELASSRQHCRDFLAALAQLAQLTYLNLGTGYSSWDDGPFSELDAGLSCFKNLQELYVLGSPIWLHAGDILPAVSAKSPRVGHP